MPSKPGRVWCVVLAAGEGRRMAPLTRALYGEELPKQFACFRGDDTLLQQTMERTSLLAPADRTVVVVAEPYEELARKQLESYAGVDVVAQPRNLGTGPGILLPLARILAREPDARVVIFPSDHDVARKHVFQTALRELEAATARAPGIVTLLGVAADRPATDLGWIVPGERMDEIGLRSFRTVHRFIEKPPESMAMLLLSSGAVWNTMIVGGTSKALWAMARHHLPVQTRQFEEYTASVGTPTEAAVVSRIYEDMLPADFSREVLERGGRLGLIPSIDSGWSDWGTPERVFRSLDSTPYLETLVDRIVARAQFENARKRRIHVPHPAMTVAHA